jgi:hypothetical protein
LFPWRRGQITRLSKSARPAEAFRRRRGFRFSASLIGDGRQETGRLALSDDKKGRKRGPSSGAGKPGPARDVGGALRSAYQKVIDEQTPDEMLDLLKKLG